MNSRTQDSGISNKVTRKAFNMNVFRTRGGGIPGHIIKKTRGRALSKNS